MNASKAPLTDRAVLAKAGQLLRDINMARLSVPGFAAADAAKADAMMHLARASSWLTKALEESRSFVRDDNLRRSQRAIDEAFDTVSPPRAPRAVLASVLREQDAADRAEKLRPGS